ncbi:transmembrane protein 41 homolog isoform X1 [Dendroctonus ponderosae]|uniref:transmembrane protein 41 homolog isoform X1 n=1 Tax=Dendroctonus ponderosae TaxID=77166 RepID=UPI0020362931|nr:transmembrane protein 41 homolog isoform X1 [Dendroctonus ponderosae]
MEPSPFLALFGCIVKFECANATMPQEISTRYATLTVLLIFITSLAAMFVVYQTFPEVTEDEKKHIKVPWNIEDAKNLGIVLSRYKLDHYYHVMSGVFLTYIFLQSFAIPGSLFLSILSGYLFPFYVALILVCTCSMLGATLCFLLSQLLGRRLVIKYFPEKASKWSVQVDKHKNNLFNYMVFLRVTPILPNWFINLAAPVLGVPLVPFALGTFIGVAPPSFFAIQGGQTLHTMTVQNGAFNLNSFMWLAVFAVVSIIPIFLKNKV